MNLRPGISVDRGLINGQGAADHAYGAGDCLTDGQISDVYRARYRLRCREV